MTARKAPEDKLPAGRPTLYREEYAEQGRKLALLMATDAEMADFFGVVEDTIHEWMRVHPKFSVSIRRGKILADAEMAEKLKHRGMGYSHEAVKIFMPAGADEPVYAPYTEHYPPDTAAASLWLRNRQPGKWRDKQERELTGPDRGPIALTVEDRRKAAAAIVDAAFGPATDGDPDPKP